MGEAMVDVSSVAGLLGIAADDARLEALLRPLGVDLPPKLKRGEADAYVELRKLGTYLVFSDEVAFRRSPGVPTGARALILTNVTAYCTPTSTYLPYEGELPFGIMPGDDANALRSKVGEPDFTDLDLNLERWTVDGLWMFVQYDGDMKSIEQLSLQLPDAE